jgi:hypothetical protein
VPSALTTTRRHDDTKGVRLITYDLRMLPPYRGVTPKVHETACVGDSAQVIGDVGLGLTT